jgi:hypothetical protein
MLARNSTRLLTMAAVGGVLVFALAAPVGFPAAGSESPIAHAQGTGPLVGARGPGAPGQLVEPRKLVATPHDPGPVQAPVVPRLYPVDAATFGQLKAQANQSAAARDRDAGAGTGLVEGPPPQFPTIAYTGWNPPDAAVAVGANHALVAVNESYAVYSRSGAVLLAPSTLQAFFGTNASVFDPRTLYDAGRERFILIATTADTYRLAISRTSDATLAWCAYALQADTTGATWADYPTLAMDGDNLYVTSNQFSNGSNTFQYARLLVIPKASVYASAEANQGCPAATSTDFRNLQNPGGGAAFTVQPAHQPEAISGQSAPMYLVNAIWSSGSNLVVRRVTSSANGPMLSAPQWVGQGFIAPYDLPADAPQPRGRAIDTGDTRLLGAVYRYGKVYTANTTRTVHASLSTSPNPYASTQWYEITPNALSDSIGSSHAVTSPGVAYFFPGILPACASCSNPTVVLQVSGVGRSQGASAFHVKNGVVTLYAGGVAGYTLGNRWGDYPALAADPSPGGPVWVLGQYARSTGSWGTALVSVGP